MSRMLEALKRIETGSPQPRRGIRPISPEELDFFGLRADADAPAEIGEPATLQPSGSRSRQTLETGPIDAKQGQILANSATDGLPGPPVEAQHPQYQGLAENILSQLPSGRAAALVFTSPAGGEGKTSTLVPLAAALADRMSGPMIAVDGNFQRPGLADRFGIESGGGLVEVLAGRTDWREVVRKTGVERLSVLPGGRFPAANDRPPESAGLARLLDELRREYRLVLLDAASLAHGETAPMIRLCDGTYLVLRLGRTARREARRAIRAVEAGGGRVLGCVLTGLPAEG